MREKESDKKEFPSPAHPQRGYVICPQTVVFDCVVWYDYFTKKASIMDIT
jgi:hypothetical protein